MDRNTMQLIKLSITCFISIIFGLIWQALELLLYGQIQPRLVDDIVGIIIIYSFYLNVGHWVNKHIH